MKIRVAALSAMLIGSSFLLSACDPTKPVPTVPTPTVAPTVITLPPVTTPPTTPPATPTTQTEVTAACGYQYNVALITYEVPRFEVKVVKNLATIKFNELAPIEVTGEPGTVLTALKALKAGESYTFDIRDHVSTTLSYQNPYNSGKIEKFDINFAGFNYVELTGYEALDNDPLGTISAYGQTDGSAVVSTDYIVNNEPERPRLFGKMSDNNSGQYVELFEPNASGSQVDVGNGFTFDNTTNHHRLTGKINSIGNGSNSNSASLQISHRDHRVCTANATLSK